MGNERVCLCVCVRIREQEGTESHCENAESGMLDSVCDFWCIENLYENLI